MRSLVRLAVKIVWQRKSRPDPTGPILFGILCNNCYPSSVSSKCCETATLDKRTKNENKKQKCGFVCLFCLSVCFLSLSYLPGWVQEVIELQSVNLCFSRLAGL